MRNGLPRKRVELYLPQVVVEKADELAELALTSRTGVIQTLILDAWDAKVAKTKVKLTAAQLGRLELQRMAKRTKGFGEHYYTPRGDLRIDVRYGVAKWLVEATGEEVAGYQYTDIGRQVTNQEALEAWEAANPRPSSL